MPGIKSPQSQTLEGVVHGRFGECLELKRSLRNCYVGIISEMTIFSPLEFLNVQEQPNGAGSC